MSVFTLQRRKPGHQANGIPVLRSHRFQRGKSSSSALNEPRPGSSCSAWRGCLPLTYMEAPSFWLLRNKDPKFKSLPRAGGLWDVSRGKLFLLSFLQMLNFIWLSFFFFFSPHMSSSPPPAWFGTTFSLGWVVEPNPWWRSQEWQPPFISMLLGLRIYLWCQT